MIPGWFQMLPPLPERTASPPLLFPVEWVPLFILLFPGILLGFPAPRLYVHCSFSFYTGWCPPAFCLPGPQRSLFLGVRERVRALILNQKLPQKLAVNSVGMWELFNEKDKAQWGARQEWLDAMTFKWEREVNSITESLGIGGWLSGRIFMHHLLEKVMLAWSVHGTSPPLHNKAMGRARTGK